MTTTTHPLALGDRAVVTTPPFVVGDRVRVIAGRHSGRTGTVENAGTQLADVAMDGTRARHWILVELLEPTDATQVDDHAANPATFATSDAEGAYQIVALTNVTPNQVRADVVIRLRDGRERRGVVVWSEG